MNIAKNDLEELYSRASTHILETFVLPEIERRQKSGELGIPVDLRAAQVIFYPDRSPPEIRINEEVRAAAKVRYKEGVAKKPGEWVRASEVEGFETLMLTENEDPDCGHATLLRLDNKWHLAFDFIYNKGLAREHLAVARQFIEVAEFSLSRELWSAFVDNLFSAAELSARATLLSLMSDAEFRKRAHHKAIHRRYNRFVNLGNADPEYTEVLNKLTKLRYPARYLDSDFSISEDEAADFLKTVKRMFEDALQLVSVAL